ncbi:MAG: AAC(3) family N-acetyltransferase [Anaerolineae bacterium]
MLLLGYDGNNSSLHLAEYRADFPGKEMVKCGAPVLMQGRSQWVWFEDITWDDADFELIGADFDRYSGLVRQDRWPRLRPALCPKMVG